MEKYKVKELLQIVEELGIELGSAKRKNAILEVMRTGDVTAEEAEEAWADINERWEQKETERRREEEREEKRRDEEKKEKRREEEREDKRREEENEGKRREHEFKMKELEARISLPAPSLASNGPRIRDQLPPFVVGEDMAKYLVKFVHVCERNGIERSLWAQNLLALLPGEASDVITCLSKEAFESYSDVKEALLRKYKLSPEAFRQRFRYAKKGRESNVDFAFRLKADLEEWLKGEEVFDDRDKSIECIALEQFYRCIDEDVRLWLQDRLKEVKLSKAAELAEEYYTRRSLHSRAVRVEKTDRRDGFSRKSDERKQITRRESRKDESLTKETVREGQNASQKANDGPKQRNDATRSFEKRKPLTCYNCQRQGHIAANCQEKIAFATIRETNKNMRLLEPYMQEIMVNGKKCRALRDSAATMDVVHPSFVSSSDFTGECAWIRQVAEEESVCLPISTVLVEGEFGKLNTEAAVSAALPEHSPYLFSNSSEQLLKDQGKSFFADVAYLALTRSKARQLSKELDLAAVSEQRGGTRTDQGNLSGEQAREMQSSEAGLGERGLGVTGSHTCSASRDVDTTPQLGDAGSTLAPVSASWQELAAVEKETLIREQQEDCFIADLMKSRLGKTKDIVENHMKAAQTLSKEYCDKSAKKRTFEVGSQVMLLRPSKKNKLEIHWEGPAKVVSKLSDTNYEVKLGGRPNKIYHSNLMKPYIQRHAIVSMTVNAADEEGVEILTTADMKECGLELMLEHLALDARLSAAQKEDLKGIVAEFKEVFSNRPGRTTVLEHDIELTSEQPIRSKP
ncbi:uncharacterized protein LOC144122958 [Amblyomma americanum]